MGLLDFGQGPNGGLLGTMQNLPVAQGAGPQKRKGPGFWRTVDGLLSQHSVGDIRDEYAAQQQAQEQAAARQAQIAQNSQGLTPEQRLAMLLAPTDFGKALSTQSEAANVAAGSSRTFGDPNAGGSVYTAPMMGVDGSYGYTQTPDSFQTTGQRGISYGEQTTRDNNSTDNALATQRFGLDRQQFGEVQRHNKATEGLGWAGERRQAAQGAVGGAGAGGGLENVSTADLMRALRGGQ